MARFYVDADVGRLVVSLLEELGHEVEYSIDAGYGERSDAFHLRHAAQGDMTLLTMNSQDFRNLHRLWNSLLEWDVVPSAHAGVLTASRQLRAAAWVEAIRDLLSREFNLIGRFYTWEPVQGRWHLDRF